MDSQAPSQSRSELSLWIGLPQTNSAGNAHGGVIMKLCDEVAAIAAIRHSGHRVVTVGFDRMTFQRPVFAGELVTVRATVNAVWRSSMEVGVRVEKEHVRTREIEHTSTAYITMVALDEDGHPAEIRPLAPETDEEHRRARQAQVRRDNRLAEREQMRASSPVTVPRVAGADL